MVRPPWPARVAVRLLAPRASKHLARGSPGTRGSPPSCPSPGSTDGSTRWPHAGGSQPRKVAAAPCWSSAEIPAVPGGGWEAEARPGPPAPRAFLGHEGRSGTGSATGRRNRGELAAGCNALPCCKDQRVRAEHQTCPHPTSQEKSKLWKLVRASTHASEPRHGWYDPRVRLDFQLRSDIRRQRFNEPGCSIYPGRILMKPRCQSTSERNARD